MAGRIRKLKVREAKRLKGVDTGGVFLQSISSHCRAYCFVLHEIILVGAEKHNKDLW